MQITFSEVTKSGKKDVIYQAELIQPGEKPPSLLDEVYLAMDTETEPIEPGLSPLPVLLQVCFPSMRKVKLVPYAEFDRYITELYKARSDLEWVFHNAPFDLNVLDTKKHPWLLDKLERGEITDIGIRFILHTQEIGKFNNAWKLDYIVNFLLGITLDKDEDVRLSFRQGVVLNDRQLKYAALDSIVTARIRSLLANPFPTEIHQNLGHYVLNDISKNGMLVDKVYMKNLVAGFQAKMTTALDNLADWGWFPDRPGNSDIVQEVLKNVEQRLKLKFPRTAKSDKIKSGEKELKDILKAFKAHPFLGSYGTYTHYKKLVTTYCNEDLLGPDGRTHSHFTPMVKTGRSSCSNPNIC